MLAETCWQGVLDGEWIELFGWLVSSATGVQLKPHVLTGVRAVQATSFTRGVRSAVCLTAACRK